VTAKTFGGDEARIGQKNKITRRWAERGTRPFALKDQRTAADSFRAPFFGIFFLESVERTQGLSKRTRRRDLVLLADAGFVLEPEFERLAGGKESLRERNTRNTKHRHFATGAFGGSATNLVVVQLSSHGFDQSKSSRYDQRSPTVSGLTCFNYRISLR